MNLLKEIKNAKNFRLNDIIRCPKTKTDYCAFFLVGHYIFETGQEKELIKQLKQDRNSILELGETILDDAIKYFENKSTHGQGEN